MSWLTYQQLKDRWPGVSDLEIVKLIEENILKGTLCIRVDVSDCTGIEDDYDDVDYDAVTLIDKNNLDKTYENIKECIYDGKSIIQSEKTNLNAAQYRISWLEKYIIELEGKLNDKNKKLFSNVEVEYLELINRLLNVCGIDIATTSAIDKLIEYGYAKDSISEDAQKKKVRRLLENLNKHS